MKIIPLTQSKSALVDDEDYEWLNQWKWYAKHDNHDCYYAARNSHKHTIRMHRLIMGLKAYNKKLVDHINHDGLDNRRSNLRICTTGQNQFNRIPSKNTASKYKGVVHCTSNANWQAQIGFKGKRIYIGCFKTETKAANAYDKKAKELFGKFAYLNFPMEDDG